MRRMLVAAIVAALLAVPCFAQAKGGSAGADRVRDSRGHIARASPPRTAFRKAHPCPATGRSSGACPGFVIDHVVPLKRGGADHPANMQWQTTADARAKDRIE